MNALESMPQRRSRQGEQTVSTVLAPRSLLPPASSGAPLDPATRAYMEPRFGHDFSRVRVHTDDRDALSARALGAKAQKQKPSQQIAPADTALLGQTQFRQPHDVHTLLRFQRRIGNQVVQQLLMSDLDNLKDSPSASATTRLAHGFSQIPLYPGKLGNISRKLTINPPGDQYEQEADHVAEQIMRNPEAKGPLAIRPLSGPARIQRNGGAYVYIRGLQAKQMYDDFVRNAERYGLPVRFLRRVGRDYDISFGGSSAVNYWLNTMTLEEADLRSASQMAPALPIGEASAIRTIYEEATHAYLDLVSDEPRFSHFIAAGERHYRGARTAGGAITTDPGRVFQEAAATYVGHRAATWWSTFESLSVYASMASSNAAAAGRLRQMNAFARLRDDYNRQMADVVFGYSEEGGFLGIGAEQAETTRAMTGEMKTFLDHELLEDKVPDRFEAVTGFQQLLNEAGVTLSSPVPVPEPAPAPAVQRQPAREGHASPLDGLESVRTVLRSSDRPLDTETRDDMEQYFGHDFSNVRVHTDSRAAESARTMNALAYTVGHDVVFGPGQYAPNTRTGKRLIAHELTHTIQQESAISDRAPEVSPDESDVERPARWVAASVLNGEFAAARHTFGRPAVHPTPLHIARDDAAPDTTTTHQAPTFANFRDAWWEFERRLYNMRDGEAQSLIPELLRLMTPEDGYQYGMQLAFYLMDHGNREGAQRALAQMEAGWRARYARVPGPQGVATTTVGAWGPGGPADLIERAEREDQAGRIEQAFRLFHLAFMIVQMQIGQYSHQRAGTLQDQTGSGQNAAAAAGSTIGRLFAYSELTAMYGNMRRILGYYPRREREARDAGDEQAARQASGLGLVLRMELRDEILPESTFGGVAITMETSRTTAPRGGPGYELHPARGESEIVTPLPGAPTPEELGTNPYYSMTMRELFETFSGQEQYISELWENPEVRRAFGRRRIDMNKETDRLRVWAAMYRHYQQNDVLGMGSLGSLLHVMERYLQLFTRHTTYNIRDFGVSYLESDMPIDLTDRAMRDCGVYALTVAHEVFRTARDATPRLPVEFRPYSMTEHVALVIFDRGQNNHYLVNNDRITGPFTGDPIATVARAYGQTVGLRNLVSPAMSISLGSSAMSDATFRRQAWQGFQDVSAWGLRPEAPRGAGDTRDEAQRREDTYRQHYQGRRDYDAAATGLHARLSRLTQDLASVQAADRPRLASEAVAQLTAPVLAMAQFFDRFGPHVHTVTSSPAVARRLGGHAQYLFTAGFEGQVPALVRFGRLLLHHQSLGGVLTLPQQQLLDWMNTIPGFQSDLQVYVNAGRPAQF